MIGRKSLIIALCCATGIGALTAQLVFRSAKTPLTGELPSQTALSTLLDHSFTDYNEKPFKLSQWSEKILVINFWATWCPPCREEMPYFSRISEQYAEKGVQFVGLSTDTAETIRLFASNHRISYPLLVGGPHLISLTAELGNRQSGLPFTLILDLNREPLLIRTGRLGEAELESVLYRATARRLDKMSRTTAN